jgi:hypothetical protein
MGSIPLYSSPRFTSTVEEVFHCYNVVEQYQEEEDPRNVKILETEGERAVEGPKLKSVIYAKPLRIEEAISSEGSRLSTDRRKFVQVRHRWYFATMCIGA